jgi:hypothetical protein
MCRRPATHRTTRRRKPGRIRSKVQRFPSVLPTESMRPNTASARVAVLADPSCKRRSARFARCGEARQIADRARLVCVRQGLRNPLPQAPTRVTSSRYNSGLARSAATICSPYTCADASASTFVGNGPSSGAPSNGNNSLPSVLRTTFRTPKKRR